MVLLSARPLWGAPLLSSRAPLGVLLPLAQGPSGVPPLSAQAPLWGAPLLSHPSPPRGAPSPVRRPLWGAPSCPLRPLGCPLSCPAFPEAPLPGCSLPCPLEPLTGCRSRDSVAGGPGSWALAGPRQSAERSRAVWSPPQSPLVGPVLGLGSHLPHSVFLPRCQPGAPAASTHPCKAVPMLSTLPVTVTCS